METVEINGREFECKPWTSIEGDSGFLLTPADNEDLCEEDARGLFDGVTDAEVSDALGKPVRSGWFVGGSAVYLD